jgi:Peptidase of plants and bacteria
LILNHLGPEAGRDSHQLQDCHQRNLEPSAVYSCHDLASAEAEAEAKCLLQAIPLRLPRMASSTAAAAAPPACPSQSSQKDQQSRDPDMDDVASWSTISSSWMDENGDGLDTARDKDKDKDKNKPALPSPVFRLHLNDLRHPGSSLLLTQLRNFESVLEAALAVIVERLYTAPSEDSKPGWDFHPLIPPTRSVTVIVHDFPEVAYTTGMELDDDHKEIHFSLSYIEKCADLPDPAKELAGVLTHELVHCYQHTAPPDAGEHTPHPPSGLIEGIADFVRLKAGLVPPHWKRPSSAKDRGSKWDEGYQRTAFFLDWLEDIRVGRGAVALVNDRLRRIGYIGEHDEASGQPKEKPSGTAVNSQTEGFWKGLFGVGVLELWEEYGRYLDSSC